MYVVFLYIFGPFHSIQIKLKTEMSSRCSSLHFTHQLRWQKQKRIQYECVQNLFSFFSLSYCALCDRIENISHCNTLYVNHTLYAHNVLKCIAWVTKNRNFLWLCYSRIGIEFNVGAIIAKWIFFSSFCLIASLVCLCPTNIRITISKTCTMDYIYIWFNDIKCWISS